MIMRNWQETMLGNHVKSVSETYKFLPNEYVVFLNTSDILNGKVLNRKLENSKGMPGQAKKRIKRGDFLFSEIRPANGRYALIDFDADKYVVSTKLMVLRCDEFLDVNFFRFYLTSRDVLEHLQMIAEDRSGTFPQITFDHISSLEIKLPPLPEQTAIASVLSSLDDKIDLLHRQNATLEKMAETLFRQWFVEEAKEEWETAKLKEVTDIAIGRTPPRKEAHWFTENPSDVKWISIKDMGNDSVFISNTSECLTKDAVATFNIPIIPKDTVVLSFKMTVGRVAITSEEMLSNEAIAHFKFNKKTPFTKEYLYIFLKTFKYDTLGSTSSIVTAINSAMIKDLEIAIPDKETMKSFKEVTESLFSKINSNQTQIRTLTALRDSLLPKLMSGEVRVEMKN